MKDFEYGNYLYSLRKEVGLSQEALAKQLGITNKAISKWENGDAKPALAQLVKLADLFGVDLQQLVSKQTENKKKQIQKIVITGGPCAGKSTAMTWIQNEFTKNIFECKIIKFFREIFHIIPHDFHSFTELGSFIKTRSIIIWHCISSDFYVHIS